jgi:hypothetical protein
MTLLNPHAHRLILIQSLAVTEQKGYEAIGMLSELAGSWLTRQPGFLSAHLHRSLDGERIVNYAEWEDEASYRGSVFRLQHDPDARRVLARLREVGREDEHLYRLARVEPPEADPELDAHREQPCYIWLIRVEPGSPESVLDRLVERGRFLLDRPSGLKNLSLHRGVDNMSLAVYEQWETYEACAAASLTAEKTMPLRHPAVEAVDARPYELVESISRRRRASRAAS